MELINKTRATRGGLDALTGGEGQASREARGGAPEARAERREGACAGAPSKIEGSIVRR